MWMINQMKISDIITDKEKSDRREIAINLKNKNIIRINAKNLIRLIKEINNLIDKKISAIQQTKEIDSEKASEIYLNILKNSPSSKEVNLTDKEILAKFISKHVIVGWKGIKHRKIEKQNEKNHIFYRLLINQPDVLEEILKIGVREYNRMNSLENI